MRNRVITLAVYLLVISSITATLSAQSAQARGKRPFEFVFGAGLATGGDELVKYRTVVTTPMFPGSTEGSSTLKAGGAVYLYLGGSFRFSGIPLRLQLTWGWFIDRTSDVDDLNSTFSRFPVEAFLYYQHAKMRMGAGLTYHMSPTFEEDLYKETIEFKNALGYFIDIGYVWRPSATISGRVTQIEYEFADGNYPIRISGESFGLMFTFSI